MKREVALAEAAARGAGRVIRAALAARTGTQAYDTKDGAIDLLTEVDLAAEQAVREHLEAATPSVPVLAEEGGGATAARTRWIVDPIDGTTNFVHGFPGFCTSIGLQVDGRLEAACVYDPVQDVAYTAGRGLGAHAAGSRLSVSQTPTLAQSLILTGFAYDRRERPDFYLRFLREVLVRAQGVRRGGAAAMDFCHIASGRGDGYYEFHLSPWDCAAGVLLVEEAGGRVTTVEGAALDLDRPEVLCTNGRIHDELSRALLPLLSSASR